MTIEQILLSLFAVIIVVEVFLLLDMSNNVKVLGNDKERLRGIVSDVKHYLQKERSENEKERRNRQVKSVFVRYDDPFNDAEFTEAKSFRYNGDIYVLEDEKGNTVAHVNADEVLYVEIVKEGE